jgi:hypothetical protein
MREWMGNRLTAALPAIRRMIEAELRAHESDLMGHVWDAGEAFGRKIARAERPAPSGPEVGELPEGWGEAKRAIGGHGEDLGYWYAESNTGHEVRLWDDGDVSVENEDGAVWVRDLRAVLEHLAARSRDGRKGAD